MRRQLFLIIALLCAVAQGAWAQIEVSTADDLKTAVQTDGANIKLMADIELSSYLNINSRTITIDLNGKTLSRNLESAGMNGHVIWIKSGMLYLKDSSGNNSGKISGGKAHNGGGIYNSGTLYFQGGTITNCRGSLTAGGIRNNGTLYLQGGVITGNHGNDGGGIYNQGTLTISGGEISNNDCSTYGGGVYSKSSSTLTITGGSITNNTAVYGGGGIDSNCNINMSGSVNITGNTVNSSANNIYMGGASTIINVKGALTGSSIGITLESNDRDFTSGFKANNSSAQPSDFFSSDASDVSLKLNGDEAYMSITSGLTYIQRSWEGDLITGKVASSTKYLTTGNYIDYDGRSEISDNKWYLFSDTHTYNDRLSIKGDAKFVLQDGCNIEFTKGIYIEQDKTLYIYGQSNDSGKLRATGSGNDANGAIGGNEDQMGGSLVIHGGIIEASSSKNNAAAIGSGDGSSSGMNSVIIYGGKVTATGMSSGAGIGGGQENSNAPSIIIYGGTVTATGGSYAAGIGGGEETGGGNITIYGGKVKATGGYRGAGIGSGEDADGGTVTIYNGTVTANGGYGGAGIGTGFGNSGTVQGGTVTIYNGTVNATSGEKGAGIGGGLSGTGGTVNIYGGDVTATGYYNGTGIGGEESATINIYGGTVKAYAKTNDDESGPAIGVKSGTLNCHITGGDVTAEVLEGKNNTPSSYNGSGAGIGGGSGNNVTLYITIDGGTVTATSLEWGAGIGSGGGGIGFVMIESGGDIKSGSEITINGGEVTATGGSYGGSGIGAGYAGNNNGTITINGGTVTTTGKDGGAGIGGGREYEYGQEGGNGGTIVINGGTVTAHADGGNSETKPAQAIGHGQDDGGEGTLTIADNLCVKNDDGSTTYTSGDRVTRCRDNGKRIIEVCEHSEKKCTSNGDSGHTINCTYCETTGNEAHTYGSDGHTCKSCDYVMTDLKTVTIYEANSTGTGYGTAATYSVQYGTTYTLPECSSEPDNMWFVGWKETTDAPSSIEVESSEFSSLIAAGESVTVTTDVTYYARYHTTVWPGGGNGTAGDPYLISTEEDWNELVNAVLYKNFDFNGRYLKLTADISVTEMVGTSSTRFRGSFDGQGHTITVSYTGITEDYCAPFRHISGATIKNLHTTGTIETSGRYAAGVVAYTRYYSTIENCRSSVTIRSSHEGWAGHGGILGLKAWVTLSKPTIKGCVFDGKILTGETATTGGGGIVGYTNGQTLTIKDCLYKPAALEYGETAVACATIYENSSSDPTTVTCTNCFYTTALGSAQGTRGYTVTNGQPSDMTLNYGNGTNYGSITAYSFDQGDETTLGGLLYDSKLYTGGTTKVTFTPKANNGQHPTLSTNSGTLAGNGNGSYTLTMASANATVTVAAETYEVTLYDGTNSPTNTETIAVNDGNIANVTILGRTLYKDGNWNTLCLPFDVTLTGSTLDEASLMELDTETEYSGHKTSYDATDGTLYLYFKPATKIKAGKPYLVKWANDGSTINSPTFNSAEIKGSSPETVESSDGKVSFIGNYDPVTLTAGAGTYYLGTGNKLYYPSTSGRTMNAFRAYFTVDLDNGGNAPQQVRSFVMNIGGESTTGVVEMRNEGNERNGNVEMRNDAWYDLQGRKVVNGKLSNSKLPKGIYIYNGHKRVIK